MQRATLAAILATVCLTPAAHADFVVTGNAPSIPAAQAPPSQAPGATAPNAAHPPKTVHWLMAYGFGHHVPLRFAAEQIIPKAVKVTYGPGADPNALVNWKGGDTWNRVLRDAVHPLGLRLVMTHMAVEIRK